MANIAAIKI